MFSNPGLSAVLLAGKGDAQLEHAVQALSDANENITSVIRTLDPISESSKELIVESVQKIIEVFLKSSHQIHVITDNVDIDH